MIVFLIARAGTHRHADLFVISAGSCCVTGRIQVRFCSDALESTVNVAASLIAWGAPWFAARPASARRGKFHLVVPGSMTVAAAHSICDRAEDALKAEMGHPMVTIHVEPEAKAKAGSVLVT